MSLYDRLQASGQRMLAKYGQATTWRSRAPSVGTATPWAPGEAAHTDHSVRMAFFPLERINKETLAQGDNEQRKGSILAYMGAVDFTPQSTDLVIRDGRELRIVSIDVYEPATTTVLYKVTLDL